MNGMYSVAVAKELEQVLVACPFDYLGCHYHTQKSCIFIRVFRPDAVAVKVIKWPENEYAGNMVQKEAGVFELDFPSVQVKFNYRIKIIKKDTTTSITYDPYQFGEYTLKQNDVEPTALYKHLGSRVIRHDFNEISHVTGVLFKIYAPQARSVSVVGDFNNWDGRIHPMASADDGIWRLFIPEVFADAVYKLEIHDQNGKCLPLKIDPFARYCEQWPGLASIVCDSQEYHWRDTAWIEKRNNLTNLPMSVYEIHLGSWLKKGSDFLSYREIADSLIPYLIKMNFTHVELLPLTEHPLYESWGYQPTGMFALTSRYGRPDDFKYFIDQCHIAGFGVILDWVPAHFPSDNHGLSRFDGTAIYEHENPSRGWHPDWGTYIYNFGKKWTQDFLISSALFWLDEYHIDGLRIDAVASMLYLDYSRNSGEWECNCYGGNQNLEAVDFLRRLNKTVHHYFPHCMTIAEESTSWDGVTRSVSEGGLGFDYKWNMGWMNDSLRYMKKPTEYRKYHYNEMLFSLVYAFSEKFILPLSHDEVVHGKGSLVNYMPGDEWQQFANLRAFYGLMYGHPGKKLLFMGSELAGRYEWNVHYQLSWELLDQGIYHKGMQRLVCDLNYLYKKQEALYKEDHDNNSFYWAIANDPDQSIFAFFRQCSSSPPVMIISNMTPIVREYYRIGVPIEGVWNELLNTDSEQYGGSGVNNNKVRSENVSAHNQNQSICLTLPPLATIFLQVVQ